MKTHFVIIMLLFSLGACEKKREERKILDGPSVNTIQTVIPAKAAQQYFLLKRDVAGVLVSGINRLAISGATFHEFSGPDGSQQYSFQLRDQNYGTANVVIQFRDGSNAVVDPITTRSSTTSVKSVVVGVTGSNALFTFSENLLITLETAGVLGSKKTMSGSSNFSGSGYTINYAFNGSGSNATFEGLTNGQVSGSGTGPSAPTTLLLGWSSSHEGNGTIIWENLSGGIYFAESGSGFVVTNAEKILIN